MNNLIRADAIAAVFVMENAALAEMLSTQSGAGVL